LIGAGRWTTTLADKVGVVAADGTGPVSWLPASITGVSSARFSGDGKWIAYGATAGSEQSVFITPAPGDSEPGRRIQVSTQGGALPVWGQADREVCYSRADGMIVSVPLSPTMQPGAETPLFRVVLRPTYASLDMSADGKAFVVNTLASEGAAPIVVVSSWKRELTKR